MRIVRWICTAFISLGCLSFGLSVLAQTTGSVAPITMKFTVNGSRTALSVPYGSRLHLNWSSTGATACRSNWTNSKLSVSGTQTGKVTKSRSFTITCRNDAEAKTATVKVTLTGATPAATPSKSPAPATKTEPNIPVPVATTAPTSLLKPSAPVQYVEPPIVQVRSPNGAEVWHPGENRTIIWTVNDSPLMKGGFAVSILDERGMAVASSTVPAGTTQYEWRIPAAFPPSARYKAEVKVLGRSEGDTSDAPFVISKIEVGINRKPPCGALGDVNADGVISTADADRANFVSANFTDATQYERKNADVNLNGSVSSSDIVEINRYIGGYEPSFSGCSFSGVSVDLRVNNIGGAVTVPENSNAVLSWSSNGGHCVFDGAVFPPSGSLSKSMGAATTTVYAIECFAVGNAQRTSDTVVVTVEVPNIGPLITNVDIPPAFRATQSHTWQVTASDPDDTLLTVNVVWGDGTNSSKTATTTITGRSMVVSFAHTYASPGTYFVTTSVKDRRNASTSHTAIVVVTDAPRTSKRSADYAFAALFEAFRIFTIFTGSAK